MPESLKDTTTAWHSLPTEDALKRLDARVHGLSGAQATERLSRFGRNELPQGKRRNAWARLGAQFKDVLILVLMAAAIVTFLIGHTTDAAVIAGVVLINAIIGFIQEGKAERALEAVSAMLAAYATVFRNGKRCNVLAAELVPGDIVALASGDRVPADIRLLRAKNLRTNEAALSGESTPVDKSSGSCPSQTVLAERRGMAYAGTTVTYGTGLGLVCTTGAHTELGRIGTLVAGVSQVSTPLTRKLDQLARRLTVFILLAAAVTLAFGILVHQLGWTETFMAVVGLAVAAIPSGLPAIVTITLAIGTQRMAKRHAIVRRLPSVETLGSVTLIFSDKTGTLTKNEMTAVQIVLPGRILNVSGAGYDPSGDFKHGQDPIVAKDADDLLALARAGMLCNDARVHRDTHDHSATWRMVGDPTEGALITLALKCGLNLEEEQSNYARIDEIAFESERQWMATLHRNTQGTEAFIALKGAPERVLAFCSTQADGARIDLDYWREHIDAAARQGQRVLAIATRSVNPSSNELSLRDVQSDYCLLGIVGLIDPPRPDAVHALQACRAAGIRVIMMTGDHSVTAATIAQQLGMKCDAPINGAELDNMTDTELARRLGTTDVIARASPEHKLRLVEWSQQEGHITAMTGDGANDAPALKRADIGVAMGLKGTDAAREASDLVLTDDNFATISNAVREGRTITDNIKKALVFILPTSAGEAGVILLAVFFGHPLPITALQILWINMVTTVTQDIALAFEGPERDVMARAPRAPSEPLMTRLLLMRAAYVTLLLVAMTFGVYHFELARGMSIEVARTAAVNVLAIGELFYLYNCRHFVDAAWHRHHAGTNPIIYAVSAVLIVLQLLITYAPPMQSLFGTAALDAVSWAVVVGVSLLKFLIVEAEKFVLRRFSVQRL